MKLLVGTGQMTRSEKKRQIKVWNINPYLNHLTLLIACSLEPSLTGIQVQGRYAAANAVIPFVSIQEALAIILSQARCRKRVECPGWCIVMKGHLCE